jgi:hypothetical protein
MSACTCSLTSLLSYCIRLCRQKKRHFAFSFFAILRIFLASNRAKNSRGLCSTKQHRPRNGTNPSPIIASIAKRCAPISGYGQNRIPVEVNDVVYIQVKRLGPACKLRYLRLRSKASPPRPSKAMVVGSGMMKLPGASFVSEIATL